MEISYERKHNDSFMVLEGRLNSSYETKMIKENNIRGLLEMNEFSIDGVAKLSYKISRKENLEDYLENQEVTLEAIQRIVINLQLALSELNQYLIDESHIYLDKETIFLEKGGDNFKVSLCYYPKDCGTIQQQFRQIMDLFLTAYSGKDRDKARQLYVAYDLCQKEDYTLSEIIECFETIEEPSPEIYVEKVSLEEEELPSIEPRYLSDYDDFEEEVKPRFFDNFLESARGFFEKKMQFRDEPPREREDFYIDPDYELEEKTVLLSESKPVGRLVYDGSSNEDDFIINKDIFRIGSSKNNDAVLKARTVSGNHAKITKEGNDYFITDSNSLNGSFLNSLPLAYRKPYKLKPLDVIRFASESYIFM